MQPDRAHTHNRLGIGINLMGRGAHEGLQVQVQHLAKQWKGAFFQPEPADLEVDNLLVQLKNTTKQWEGTLSLPDLEVQVLAVVPQPVLVSEFEVAVQAENENHLAMISHSHLLLLIDKPG